VRGSLEYWIRRYGVVRYLVVLVALLAGGVIAVTVFHPAQSTQVTLAMKPAAPLTTAACVRQARQYGGYSAGAAGPLCATGRGLSWYHARLTNQGGNNFTRCRATGYDAGGRVVFRGLVPFDFAGPRGLFALGHRSIEFSWYLPREPGAGATRYVTACTARQYPWS
jgi:hypothetical protein